MKPTLPRLALIFSTIAFATIAFATVAFATVALPASAQRDEKVIIKEDKVKIKIKGEGAGEALTEDGPDIFADLAVGSVIPRDQRGYLIRVPDEYMVRIQPPADDVIARFYRGRVYDLDEDTYRILDIVTF